MPIFLRKGYAEKYKSLVPFHGRQGFSKECVKCFLQHWPGPLKWWAFYCFCGKENGGDKRDNLNWQMAFLNREKVISSGEFGRWNRVDGGGKECKNLDLFNNHWNFSKNVATSKVSKVFNEVSFFCLITTNYDELPLEKWYSFELNLRDPICQWDYVGWDMWAYKSGLVHHHYSSPTYKTQTHL